MSAAADILRHAIEDAVQQLEPQLLPLFGGGARHRRGERAGRGECDEAVRPTQRTHTALKTLVALTRFFPDEHRVRRAGHQLEMIWPPLVHEPTGSAAGKLLQYYFRLREDLLASPEQALRGAMHAQVRGALEAAQASYDPAQAETCERRLQQLAAFVPRKNLEMLPCATSLSPLARLCAWQQVLEFASCDARTAPLRSLHPALLPDTLALLDNCTALCRASDWSLDYFCNSGLSRGLWQLRGLARFSGSAAFTHSSGSRACSVSCRHGNSWSSHHRIRARHPSYPTVPCTIASSPAIAGSCRPNCRPRCKSARR
jgi:hypothetical protein